MKHNAAEIEEKRREFAAFVSDKGMRNTSERFAILEKALAIDSHFSAEELYNGIVDEYRVSRATVYNTLELLCECGILVHLHLGRREGFYEKAGRRHIHFLCIRCGKMKTLADKGALDAVGAHKLRGFRPLDTSVTVSGICGKCDREIRKLEKIRDKKTESGRSGGR